MLLLRLLFVALPVLGIAACQAGNTSSSSNPVTHPTTSSAFSPTPSLSLGATPAGQ